MSEQMQLILDTDVGGDDLFCLTLLLCQPEKVRIHLITTVRGLRTDGEEAVRRIKRLIKFLEYPYEVEVIAGEFRKHRHCFTEMDFVYKLHDEFFLGDGNKFKKPWEDRMEFPKLKEKKFPEVNVAKRMSELIENQKNGFFTLLCIGPLMNISQLLCYNDKVIPRLRKLVVMGGAVKMSNVFLESSFATKNEKTEWNFYCSPKSVVKLFDTLKKYPGDNKYFISTIEGSFDIEIAKKLKEKLFSEENKLKVMRSKKSTAVKKAFNTLFSLIQWNEIASLYDSVTAANLFEKIIEFKKMTCSILVDEGKEGMSFFSEKKANEKTDLAVCEVGIKFSEIRYVKFLKKLFGID